MPAQNEVASTDGMRRFIVREAALVDTARHIGKATQRAVFDAKNALKKRLGKWGPSHGENQLILKGRFSARHL